LQPICYPLPAVLFTPLYPSLTNASPGTLGESLR
jgi:hypothetical protein